ncbi:phosphotransferase [Phycicoccus flavus]|uniref:phosphotransferase n=1 Tax=Phycicoccus flavus TaxID=2502783 RepID=UPI000FEBB981|nr:phosphotransferase [Phycicoccus flavus]NHA67780.1 phosphotransferase [Phycicoccus flavus]
MRRIHDEEADTGEDVVRSLVRSAGPAWAGLPLRPLSTSGTDHAMYRLGDDLVVRLPRTAGAAESLVGELGQLEVVARVVPVPVPVVVHRGEPDGAYPYPWAVLTWLDGEDAWAARDRLGGAADLALAEDLAAVVTALRAASPTGLVRRGSGRRGGPLAGVLDRAHRWLAGESGPLPAWVDTDRVRRRLDRCAGAADADVAYVPTHGDLIPGNLLVRDGRLTAVIDWGYLTAADPALDVVPAWAVLDGPARRRYRSLLDVDDATWARAWANGVEQALGGIAYYTPRGHPLADVMSRTLRRHLEDS